ncbi:MAG: NAD-binding protein, partial [Rhodospirillales bacterium]
LVVAASILVAVHFVRGGKGISWREHLRLAVLAFFGVVVNQICFIGVVQSLAEGLDFAVRAGLDAKKVAEVISKGAAQSWQMDNRANTMIDDEFDFGFAVDWVRKDLSICLAEAARNGSRLPVTEIINGYYGEIQEMGGGRWDTSSLIRRFTGD